MKSNLQDLSSFYAELKRQEEKHKDFLVPSSKMKMEDDSKIAIDGEGAFLMSDIAHGQVAERLGIPKKYYDAIEEIPGLRTINVNEQMRHRENTSFVRTLDTKVRAVLSDRFKPIDNFPLVSQALLPVTQEFEGLKVLSHSITDRKMYLQFVLPSLAMEIRKGDVIYYGVTITNSEVGLGSLNIEEMLYRLVCSNGAIGQSIIRKYHAGRKLDTGGDSYDIFANETIEADARAYQLQIRDILRHTLTQSQLERAANPWIEATEQKIEKPIETVKNVTKQFSTVIYESDVEKLINKLSITGDMTKFGLANAVTNFAQEVGPDRAYELEKTGQRIIELTPKEWSVMAAA